MSKQSLPHRAQSHLQVYCPCDSTQPARLQGFLEKVALEVKKQHQKEGVKKIMFRVLKMSLSSIAQETSSWPQRRYLKPSVQIPGEVQAFFLFGAFEV